MTISRLRYAALPSTTPRGGSIAVASALGAGLGVGLGVGVATSYLQGVLPGSWNFLANSGAVWSLIAFGAAAAFRVRRAVAVLVGTVALLGEVLGYYAIASVMRDIATSGAERVLWTTAALLIGPAVGFAGHCVRSGAPSRRSAAWGGMAGLVAGEALHALCRLGYPVQGWILLAVAVVTCALAAVLLRRAGALLVTAALATGAVYVAYGVF